ncbi:hypothetical protein TNCV_2755401 [Trichonephila clavipes]|nr:hypothetical protein TNCV_2755401 [Trichonephila clavipes]
MYGKKYFPTEKYPVSTACNAGLFASFQLILLRNNESLNIILLETFLLRRRDYANRGCDEAHFWLNGYVNKQNCRIWSEANPQVYVETPLHPEKLTVWCALWAGGILLQKR